MIYMFFSRAPTLRLPFDFAERHVSRLQAKKQCCLPVRFVNENLQAVEDLSERAFNLILLYKELRGFSGDCRGGMRLERWPWGKKVSSYFKAKDRKHTYTDMHTHRLDASVLSFMNLLKPEWKQPAFHQRTEDQRLLQDKIRGCFSLDAYLIIFVASLDSSDPPNGMEISIDVKNAVKKH